MGGRASRLKGQRAEREAAGMFRRLYPKAERGDPQSRGARQCDVENTPFRIEAKHRKGYIGIRAALRQCKKDAETYNDSRPRCVVVKQDYDAWVIAFDLEEFIENVLRDPESFASALRARMARHDD